LQDAAHGARIGLVIFHLLNSKWDVSMLSRRPCLLLVEQHA
jgi:hypothetical protein